MRYTPARQGTVMEHRAIQYQPWETSFLPTEAPEDPYRNGYLRAEITDPYGDIRWREGFWDGGVWRLRWMPLEEGPHHLRIETNLGGLPKSLGIVAAPAPLPTPTFRNELAVSGPVRIADDRVRFSRHDGHPFFLKSDTAFSAAMRASDAEWAFYIQKRKEQGFTAVCFMASNWIGLPSDRYGRTSFDLHTGDPDLAAMADLDHRVAALNAHGMVAIPCLFHDARWATAQGPEGLDQDGEIALREEEAIRIGRHMVARWGAYDVMWLLAGNAGSRSETTDAWARIGRGIFGDDPWRAPVAMRLFGIDGLHPDLQNEPWLAWIAYASGHLHDGPSLGQIRQDLATMAARPAAKRPIVNLAPAEEGFPSNGVPQDAAKLRRASYNSLFAAPPAGIGYEAFGMWSWRAESTPESDDSMFVPSWSEALEFEGALQIAGIERKIARYHWNALFPALHLLEAQPFPDDPFAHVGVLSNSDGSMIRAYVPRGGPLRFSSLAGSYSAYWVDPRRDGADVALSEATAETVFLAPSDEDWILELDSIDRF